MNNGIVFNPPKFPNLEVQLTLVGWTYKQLGDFLGLQANAISERMRGKTEFKLTEMTKVSDLFNKPINILFSEVYVKE